MWSIMAIQTKQYIDIEIMEIRWIWIWIENEIEFPGELALYRESVWMCTGAILIPIQKRRNIDWEENREREREFACIAK